MTFYSRLIVIAGLITAGLIGIFGTSNLAMFDDSGLPGARLWPMAMAVVTIALGVINFIEVLFERKTLSKKIDTAALARTGLFFLWVTVLTIVFSDILGFFTSMFVFLIISLWKWNEQTIKLSVVISFGVVSVCYFIFSYLLGIAQFPTGLFV